MNRPKEKYILWINNGDNGYTPNFFNTMEEVLVYDKYSSDWYITESINNISAYGNYKEPKNETK